MAMIYVNTSGIRDTNYDLPEIGLKAGIVKKHVRKLKREIPDCILGRYQIGKRLEHACREIEQLERQLEELYEVTNSCAQQYDYIEYKNERNARMFFYTADRQNLQ